MVKTIKWLSLSFMLFSYAIFAQVTASVSKNPVIAGESFVLEVVADKDLDNNAFNSDALLKDFIVGRTGVSSQTSMINFKTSYSTRWTTVLIAKKAGTYTIPAFTVAGEQTQAITLTVLPPSAAGNIDQKDFFIKTQVSRKTVYVQQQFTLQVKLYFAAELKRGSLTEPELEGASISQIGKDQENVELLNGRRYRVIERNYAINPEQSGEFTLKTPMFSGEIVKTTNRRTTFFGFSETTPISILGKEIPITVKAIPSNYQGDWLPSELLSLHEKWQPSNKQFKVGEPITREITLTAAGLSEEQLPKLSMSVPNGLKVYPDQAKLHTSINNKKLVSQKVKSFAIVASKAGTYTLPKIVIPWWNTVTNKYQEAILPEQTITIAANKEFSQAKEKSTLEQKTNGVQTNTTQANGQNTENSTPALQPTTIIVEKTPLLQWLFLALWLLTSLAWFISSRLTKNKSEIVITKKTDNKLKYSYQALIEACQRNQGKIVLTMIVPWVNSLAITDHKITTIDEALTVINDQAFSQAINELQQCYYRDHNQTWHGENLLKLIKQIQQQTKSAKHKKEVTVEQPNKLNLNP